MWTPGLLFEEYSMVDCNMNWVHNVVCCSFWSVLLIQIPLPSNCQSPMLVWLDRDLVWLSSRPSSILYLLLHVTCCWHVMGASYIPLSSLSVAEGNQLILADVQLEMELVDVRRKDTAILSQTDSHGSCSDSTSIRPCSEVIHYVAREDLRRVNDAVHMGRLSRSYQTGYTRLSGNGNQFMWQWHWIRTANIMGCCLVME